MSKWNDYRSPVLDRLDRDFAALGRYRRRQQWHLAAIVIVVFLLLLFVAGV